MTLKIAIFLAFVSASLLVSCYEIDEYTKYIQSLNAVPANQAKYDATVRRLMRKDPHYFDYSPFRNTTYAPFTCNTTATYPKATSVHELRPGDIKASIFSKS